MPRARSRARPRGRGVRRRLGRLYAGLLALACAAGFAAALGAPAFVIREVAVAGAARIDPGEVRDRSGLFGENAFRASVSDAAARVRGLPAVRDARVTVLLPDRARVEVEERIPVAVISAAGQRLFVDHEGALFSAVATADALPTLEDESARHAPGERIDAALVVAARTVAALQPAYFGRQVERLRLTQAYGLVLTLERGTEVRLGSTDRLDAKLDAARRVVLPRASRRLDYVDVRSLDGIAYFPQD